MAASLPASYHLRALATSPGSLRRGALVRQVSSLPQPARRSSSFQIIVTDDTLVMALDMCGLEAANDYVHLPGGLQGT